MRVPDQHRAGRHRDIARRAGATGAIVRIAPLQDVQKLRGSDGAVEYTLAQ